MSDLIDRQAAIDALNEYFVRIGKLKRRGLTQGEKAISLDTVGAIKTLPSAEPKQGKWTVTPIYIKCSECGESFMLIPQNYCPYCGCRMDVE